MKKIITTTLAAGLIAGMAFAEEEAVATTSSEVPATEVSVSADFVSAYVFRGTTFNDGFVIQPGLEATGFGLPEGAGSLTLGTWGNFDVSKPDGGANSSEFSEVDWYISYGLPTLVDGLDISIGWCEYTYPTAGIADKEASIGLGTELAGVSLGAGAYYMTGGDFKGQLYLDFAASYAIEISEDLEASVGALVGYVQQADGTVSYKKGGADDGLNEGVLDAALSYAVCENWSVGVSVAYIAQLDDQVLADYNDKVSPGGYDVDFVGMLSIAGAF